jgi:hypothetical protein
MTKTKPYVIEEKKRYQMMGRGGMNHKSEHGKPEAAQPIRTANGIEADVWKLVNSNGSGQIAKNSLDRIGRNAVMIKFTTIRKETRHNRFIQSEDVR